MAYAPGIDLWTLKLLPFGGTQRSILGAAGSAAWTQVTTAAAYIPKGTKALWAHGFARSGAAAAGQVTLAYAFDKVNTGTASWDRCPYVELNYNAAGATAIYADAQTHLIIPVDASGYFYYYRTAAVNTATPMCYLVLLGYYL